VTVREESAGVLVLAGPTAVGKTDLALALAERFGAEIISADARQIYRGMPLGTAAPTAQERARAAHHLVAFLDPQERYSAARFAHDARAAIHAIHARGKRAIVAGGTGFYIRALCGGVQLSAAYDPVLRARLAREARLHPPEILHAWLVALDAQRAATIAPSDGYRVLRALEIALAGDARRDDVPPPDLPAAGLRFAKIFIDRDDAALEERIAARVDAMLAAGFVAEAERIGADVPAADAVGYPHAFAYVRGWCTRDELRALLVRATRRYARRQRTWFRAEPNVTWLAAENAQGAAEEIARDFLGWP
jgi:tRNA dimethylallyltransferase